MASAETLTTALSNAMVAKVKFSRTLVFASVRKSSLLTNCVPKTARLKCQKPHSQLMDVSRFLIQLQIKPARIRKF